ncbi:MAG: class I SAM-dependent methyltransferase [Methanocalculus sp. MSAO_Arc1]|uniref:class I SAM-dependent methyltransferase n=1 Tax=Methanocalculus TaxID=71151 RepID=UPI000FF6580F|nr:MULTISPECIES: methyltransferase domain-containing protein [unclassified Methanocalculus]MCP1662890.1 SAM-dependent methyltransferase [Methanocalculus sp. AMF5]RQD80039.1 MAG: class I SAM-dependent methyltransferase [Methanocalculus sp. MSAO_Arc1]
MYQIEGDNLPQTITPEVLFRKAILRLALKGHERLLHCGSADALETAALAACLSRGSVVGLSPGLTRDPGDLFLRNRYQNITFIASDIEKMHFSGEFDTIFSQYALNWAVNPKKAYEALYTALSPEGRILIWLDADGLSEEVVREISALLNDPAWSGYFREYSFPYSLVTEDEAMELCEDAGFYLLSLERIERLLTFPDESSFAAWVEKTWHPLVSRLDRSVSDQFVSALMGIYQTLYHQSGESGATIPVAGIEIEGRRN